jgi:Ca2+-binding EF-hand superfamily protein
MNRNHLQLTKLAVLALAVAVCQTAAAAPNRFDQADANHDKLLSLDEINTYLVGEIFDSRDKNKDKRMTRAEWGTAIESGREKDFRDRDANNDGVVTMDEALAYGRKKGLAKQLLHDADTNKDGKLSREEVKAYYASKEGPVR